MIVIDHHLAVPELPVAHAIVNPNRLDDTTPHKQLAAVGVAFLVVVAVNRALRDAGWYSERDEPDLLGWLDLIALGTICDVAPLTGLNRALVAQGLKILSRRSNPGIAALADIAGIDEPPGTYHAGFVLGPRVNAGGRVGRADLGARLLSTESAAEARSIAEELDRLNAERRALEAEVQEQAVALAAEQDAANPLVFVAAAGWHAGVIGIVASRLKERFRKPAIVVGIDGDIGRGSGRSVPGVDLGAAVTAARQADLLINGGGHPMAAGLRSLSTRWRSSASSSRSGSRDRASTRTRRPAWGSTGRWRLGALRSTCSTSSNGPVPTGRAIPRRASRSPMPGWCGQMWSAPTLCAASSPAATGGGSKRSLSEPASRRSATR